MKEAISNVVLYFCHQEALTAFKDVMKQLSRDIPPTSPGAGMVSTFLQLSAGGNIHSIWRLLGPERHARRDCLVSLRLFQAQCLFSCGTHELLAFLSTISICTLVSKEPCDFHWRPMTMWVPRET